MISSMRRNKLSHTIVRNDITYRIEPIISMKYGISENKVFTEIEWNKIISENDQHYYDRIGLERLKKPRTKQELKLFLLNKKAPSHIVDLLIMKYESYNYINDKKYAKQYVENFSNKQGPKLIIDKLTKKGVMLKDIEQALSNTKQDEIIDSLVLDLINNNKTKTKKELTQSIKRSLSQKGYENSLIDNSLIKHIDKYTIDEKKLLELEYEKAILRRKKLLDEDKFKLKLANKLSNKGFNLEDIKNEEEKHFKDS